MSKISIFAIACATSLVAVMTCAGQTWDAHNDFSITNNPNGQWTYGWSTTLTSALNLYTRHSTDAGTGVQAWDDPTNSFLGAPDVANNPSNNQAGLLPPNSSSFHPGANGEFSHYVWTAPFDGTFSLSATFSPFDMGGTDVHILENGAQIFEGEVSPGVPQSFNPLLPLVLLSGATLDFAVGRGIDGTFYYDTTGIAATISTGGSVPDGGMTVSMFGLGLAGIAFLRRKFA